MSPRPRAKQAPAAPVVEQRDQIAELLKHIGTAERIFAKLERMNGREYEYLGTIDPLTPELVEDVQERYGGGKYKARVFDDTGYVKGGMLHFNIAGRAKTDGGDDREHDDRLARIEAKLENPPAASSGLTMVKEIVGVVTPLITLLVPLLKSSGNGGSVTETLALMQSAEEKGERRGVRLGRLESGGSEQTMLGVADKYLPPILSMMADRAKGTATHPPVMSRSTNEPIPEHENGQMHTSISPAPEYAWLTAIRPYFHLLGGQAQHDADPAVVADFALTQLDDAQLQAVAIAVKRADFLETMRGELAPLVARYPDWVTDFLERIVEVGTMQDDDTPTETPRDGKKQTARKRST